MYTNTALTTQYIINNTPSGGCVGLGTPGSTVWARGGVPGTGQIEGSAGTCSSTTTTTTTTATPTTTTTTTAAVYYSWNLYTNQFGISTTNICNNTAPLVTLYTSVASLGVGVILYTNTALTTQYQMALASSGCVGLGTPGSTVWAKGAGGPPGQIEGSAGTC